jgi:hypothetical protein
MPNNPDDTKHRPRPGGRNANVRKSDRPPGPSRVEDGLIPMHIASVLGFQSRDAMVELTLGSEGVLLDADAARQWGLWFLEAAEAAQTDKMMLTVLMDTGMTWEDAAKTVMLLRQAREVKRGMGVKSA